MAAAPALCTFLDQEGQKSFLEVGSNQTQRQEIASLGHQVDALEYHVDQLMNEVDNRVEETELARRLSQRQTQVISTLETQNRQLLHQAKE